MVLPQEGEQREHDWRGRPYALNPQENERREVRLEGFSRIIILCFCNLAGCFLSRSGCLFWSKEEERQMMTFLKVVFCILLCCPLAYGFMYLFTKLVDDATKKR